MEYFLKKPDGFLEVLSKGCMNKYEEKFKKVVAAKVTSLESRETAIKKVENSIANVRELLKSLQGSASGAVALQEVPFEVKSEFVEYNMKQLGELLSRQCIYKGEGARIRKELTILQSVCPHEDTTFDHKDYHKNEDYYKCNTCGMIV